MEGGDELNYVEKKQQKHEGIWCGSKARRTIHTMRWAALCPL